MQFIEGVKKFKGVHAATRLGGDQPYLQFTSLPFSSRCTGFINSIRCRRSSSPDIVVPTISITTIYVGNSARILKTWSRGPLKQLKGISGARVKKINSISQTDYSLIIFEFDTDVKTELAKQKVKDAIDQAQTDLPNDLTSQPNAQEFAFHEMPIMYVNVSGD